MITIFFSLNKVKENQAKKELLKKVQIIVEILFVNAHAVI